MLSKARAAAVAALLLSAASVASADTIGLESDWGQAAYNFNANVFTVTGGQTYDLNSYDLLPYTYNLTLFLDPSTAVYDGDPVVLPLDPNDPSAGTFTIPAPFTGTFNGTYQLLDGTTVLSEGTATAHGDVNFFGQPALSFTNGSLLQTDPSLPGLFGSTAFTFQADVNQDGGLFVDGQLTAGSPVPLPASATMGLGLIGLLGAAHVARRRFRAV